MAKVAKKIPSTAKLAKKKGYAKVTVEHGVKEKKKWVMLKQRGNWAFAKAGSATASGSHTVCYYDPNTGLYDDCHTVQD
jgi:hypothetical protein